MNVLQLKKYFKKIETGKFFPTRQNFKNISIILLNK